MTIPAHSLQRGAKAIAFYEIGVFESFSGAYPAGGLNCEQFLH
jgi:hypothetical protein